MRSIVADAISFEGLRACIEDLVAEAMGANVLFVRVAGAPWRAETDPASVVVLNGLCRTQTASSSGRETRHQRRFRH